MINKSDTGQSATGGSIPRILADSTSARSDDRVTTGGSLVNATRSLDPSVASDLASRDDWFQTASGGVAFLLDPPRSTIDIRDIAHALSRICRFGGHLRRDVPHYSVAQHCVLVSEHCAPENALVGLLHDAAEAYLGDVISPLKRRLDGYRVLEHAWEQTIGERFGLGSRLVNQPQDVKDADRNMLATERRCLLEPGPATETWRLMDAERGYSGYGMQITALGQEAACGAYLKRFLELTGRTQRE